jgi:hypothetical protein
MCQKFPNTNQQGIGLPYIELGIEQAKRVLGSSNSVFWGGKKVGWSGLSQGNYFFLHI